MSVGPRAESSSGRRRRRRAGLGGGHAALGGELGGGRSVPKLSLISPRLSSIGGAHLPGGLLCAFRCLPPGKGFHVSTGGAQGPGFTFSAFPTQMHPPPFLFFCLEEPWVLLWGRGEPARDQHARSLCSQPSWEGASLATGSLPPAWGCQGTRSNRRLLRGAGGREGNGAGGEPNQMI